MYSSIYPDSVARNMFLFVRLENITGRNKKRHHELCIDKTDLVFKMYLN